jgi:phosphate transport system protein
VSVPSESRPARADGELRTDMLRLFALVVESVQVATAALLEADLQAVTRVLEGDLRIDQLTHAIEARTYELLANAGGEAVRLRCLVAILRIAQELERTGDLMTSVAKAARRLYPNPLDPRAPNDILLI